MSRRTENMSDVQNPANARELETHVEPRISARDNDPPATSRKAPASALLDTGLHEKITAISGEGKQFDSANPSIAGPATYPIDKLDAHLQNIPHSAISIFVFSRNHLLLQQRAATKYHSAGLWANTVCSHPRWQETASSCAQRRLQEELGWTTPLIEGEKIDYHAQVGELYENEQVQCFFGSLQDESNTETSIEKLSCLFNPGEVSNLRWMDMQEIDCALQATPEIFSAWFQIYMSTHRDKLQRMMEAATSMQVTYSN